MMYCPSLFYKDISRIMNNINYDEQCRIVGDLYLNAQAQRLQFQALLENMKQEIANLQQENRQLKELYQCSIQKENT